MRNDLFNSVFSRDQLADMYSDLYFMAYGELPDTDDLGRAALVDCIETLSAKFKAKSAQPA